MTREKQAFRLSHVSLKPESESSVDRRWVGNGIRASVLSINNFQGTRSARALVEKGKLCPKPQRERGLGAAPTGMIGSGHLGGT